MSKKKTPAFTVIMRILWGVTAAAVLFSGSYLFVDYKNAQKDFQDAQTKLSEVEESQSGNSKNISALQSDVSQRENEKKRLEESMKARKGDFSTNLATLSALLDEIGDSFSTDTEKQKITEIQNTVSDTSTVTAEIVEKAAKDLAAIESDLQSKLDKYQSEQAAKAKREAEAKEQAEQNSLINQTDWIVSATDFLNSLGEKSTVLKKYDGECGKAESDLCSQTEGTIQYTEGFTQLSEKEWKWELAKAIAMQKQMRVEDSLQSSEDFEKLFKGNANDLASCMVVSVNIPSTNNTNCSSEQVAFAKKVWNEKITVF